MLDRWRMRKETLKPHQAIGLVSTVGSVWDSVRPGSVGEVVPVGGVFAGVVVAGFTGVLPVDASSAGVVEGMGDFLLTVLCLCCFLAVVLAAW